MASELDVSTSTSMRREGTTLDGRRWGGILGGGGRGDLALLGRSGHGETGET